MASQSNHILIVDDDATTRKLLTAILGKYGYSITEAPDGEDAWQLLQIKSGRFDLVLLDRKMPRLDGVALLTRLKSEKSLCHIPVILLSGMTEDADFIEGIRLGAHGYLAKPINAEMLLTMIRTTIRNDHLRKNLKEEICFLQTALLLTVKSHYQFRTLEEAESLAYLLGKFCPASCRSRQGLYELFVNAIEHGNLEISYEMKTKLLMENRWYEEVMLRLKQPKFSERYVSVEIEQDSGAFL